MSNYAGRTKQKRCTKTLGGSTFHVHKGATVQLILMDFPRDLADVTNNVKLIGFRPSILQQVKCVSSERNRTGSYHSAIVAVTRNPHNYGGDT